MTMIDDLHFSSFPRRTSTKKKTLDPVWNEEIEVHISPYLHKYIQLSVFDENRITRFGNCVLRRKSHCKNDSCEQG